MKKSIVAGLLAAGLLVFASGSANAGSIRDCVIEKGATELSEAQMTLLKAHGDGEINIFSTFHDNDLNLMDSAKVHTVIWLGGTACVLGG